MTRKYEGKNFKEHLTSCEGDKVGYGNPPRCSRFQKGRSGNPYGRRKRLAQTADEMLMAERERTVRVQEGRRVVTISTERLIYARSIADAARGHIPSMKRVFAEMAEFERKRGFGNVPWNENHSFWDEHERKMRHLFDA